MNARVEWAAGLVYIQDAVTSSPNPGVSNNVPWIWWDRGLAHDPAQATPVVIRADISSKRLFRNQDDRIHFIMRNDDASDGLLFQFGLRLLYSLP